MSRLVPCAVPCMHRQGVVAIETLGAAKASKRAGMTTGMNSNVKQTTSTSLFTHNGLYEDIMKVKSLP